MLEKELEYKIRESFFSSEREIQYAIMNALFKRGISVWNCSGEAGKCIDPIRVGKIYFGIVSGDFPIFYNGKFYAFEIKFSRMSCKLDTRKGYFAAGREMVLLHSKQIELLLGGSGVLIIVAEPLASELTIERPKGNTKIDCEKKLRKAYKRALAESRIPYEVYLLDHKGFKSIWDTTLKEKSFESRTRKSKEIMFKRLSLSNLKRIIPEVKSLVSINKFLNGDIADIILHLLE